jgi:uncharacterized protein YcbX
MAIGVISELVIYPVKSLQGISLDKSMVTEQGLKWDRHWMIVNDDGLFLTQRTWPEMATIQTSITDTHLILKHPEHEPLQILLESNSTEEKQAKVWKSECQVLDEGLAASDWLVQVLGLWREQKLHLVRMSPDFKRQVSVKHSQGNKNTTNFADGYPFLITNTNSLLELNNELQAQDIPTIPMNRFRGNIIVDNVPAFIEHQSDNLRLLGQDETQVGVIDFCNPCQRCPVPGIDQFTAQVPTPQQPLKTLFNMQHVPDKGAFFGQNAVLAPSSKSLPTFMIAIGDKVEFVNENH